jgi:hypothetical protein
MLMQGTHKRASRNAGADGWQSNLGFVNMRTNRNYKIK